MADDDDDDAPPKQLTHYQVLHVTPTATYEEIKVAFHRMARRQHPDRQQMQQARPPSSSLNNGVEGDCLQISSPLLPFPIIQQAWETLRDVENRKQYDAELLSQQLAAKKSQSGAIAISRKDLEEAVDEASGELFYVYDCRCGEQLEMDNNDLDGGVVTIECPGCCFVYRVVDRLGA